MRTFISLLVVLILCVAALGFWRGWFTFTGPHENGDGNKINVQLSVDPDKMKADAERAKDKASDLSGEGKKEPR